MSDNYYYEILGLIPSVGKVPRTATDTTSNVIYDQWEVDDEAGFIAQVPDKYYADDQTRLQIHESTPGSGVNHKWNFEVTLLRPGTHETDEAEAYRTFSQSYQCSDTEDLLTTRTINLTDAYAISGVEIQSGDLLTVMMSRVAADGSEDPNPIKVTDYNVIFPITTAVTSTYSPCSGRLGSIVDVVLTRFNEESDSGFISYEFVVRECNQCLYNLARDNMFTKKTWVDITSGVNYVSLLDDIEDFETIHLVYLSGAAMPLSHVDGFPHLTELLLYQSGFGTISGWTNDNEYIYFWPTPSGDITSGLCVYHSYVPDDLDCLSGYTPPVPKSHDDVFVLWCLKEAWQKDTRSIELSQLKTQEYEAKYLEAKNRLLEAFESKTTSFIPG